MSTTGWVVVGVGLCGLAVVLGKPRKVVQRVTSINSDRIRTDILIPGNVRPDPNSPFAGSVF